MSSSGSRASRKTAVVMRRRGVEGELFAGTIMFQQRSMTVVSKQARSSRKGKNRLERRQRRKMLLERSIHSKLLPSGVSLLTEKCNPLALERPPPGPRPKLAGRRCAPLPTNPGQAPQPHIAEGVLIWLEDETIHLKPVRPGKVRNFFHSLFSHPITHMCTTALAHCKNCGQQQFYKWRRFSGPSNLRHVSERVDRVLTADTLNHKYFAADDAR